MNKIINKILAIGFLGGMLLTACSKELDPNNSGESGSEPDIPSYVITSEETVTVDEFLSLINNPLASLVSASFFEGAVNSTLVELDSKIQLFKKLNIRIRRVNFTYSSSDRLGRPLTLSAHLCYPVKESGKYDINSISLYSHIMTPDDSFIPTKFFCIGELRAFHGAAVVIPDYQGSGSSYDAESGIASPLTDARQSVESLLVARDIISKCSNACLEKGYHTDNIGISRGGLVSLAVQNYLEGCEDESIVKAANIKGTFFAEVNPYFWDRFEIMSGSDNFLTVTGWYQTIASAYYLFPECMEGLDFSDFFNEDFNAYKVIVGGKSISMKDALRQQKWNLLEQLIAWGGLGNDFGYEILNSEFCNADGTFNKDSRQWKALDCVAEKYNFLSHWSLEHPMTVGMHVGDYMFPFSDVKSFVEDLRSRTEQEVRLISCDVMPEIINDSAIVHAVAALYWEFYTASHKGLY